MNQVLSQSEVDALLSAVSDNRPAGSETGGGDAKAGAEIFNNQPVMACVKCHAIGGQGKFGLQCRQPAIGRRIPQLGRGVGVEVAVSASGGAERHVHVDAERGTRGQGESGQIRSGHPWWYRDRTADRHVMSVAESRVPAGYGHHRSRGTITTMTAAAGITPARRCCCPALLP